MDPTKNTVPEATPGQPSPSVQPPIPVAAVPIQAYAAQPVTQSYGSPSASPASGNKKKKLIIGAASTAVLLLMIGGGVFAAMTMNSDDKKSAQSTQSKDVKDEEQETKAEVITPQPAKPEPAEPAVDPTKYPANLRAIYVNACSSGQKSLCECEVDYFEKNLAVEKFREAMEQSKQSEEYMKVFADALNACDP